MVFHELWKSHFHENSSNPDITRSNVGIMNGLFWRNIYETL